MNRRQTYLFMLQTAVIIVVPLALMIGILYVAVEINAWLGAGLGALFVVAVIELVLWADREGKL